MQDESLLKKAPTIRATVTKMGASKAEAPKKVEPVEAKREVVGATKESRSLVSVKPSEASARVSLNGKVHKVVYHLRSGVPMIGVPGEGSIPLEDWLSGKVSLKNLAEV